MNSKFTFLRIFHEKRSRSGFNNYVDKMRGEGSVFVYAQGKKTVHAGGESKEGKIMST
jgi:hypothetical protein